MDIRRALASLKHLGALAYHLCLQAIKLLIHDLGAPQVWLDPLGEHIACGGDGHVHHWFEPSPHDVFEVLALIAELDVVLQIAQVD